MAAALREVSRTRGECRVISYPKGGGEHYLIAGTTKSYQCAIAADATAIACLHMTPIDRSPASLFTTSTSNPNVKEPTIHRVETREDNLEDREKPLRSSMSRRSFLGTSLAVGAGTIGAGLLANAPTASASVDLAGGGADIQKFLAAAEIIEADLWQQYNELGGIQDSEVPGGTGNPAYTAALAVLDEDMDQYIHDNTDDEITHWNFLNAYLVSKGAAPANLDPFRTLMGSTATGVNTNLIGHRLTNLTQLTVDTSWWTRYRDDRHNPDFNPNHVFPQAVPTLGVNQHTAIPRTDADTTDPNFLQAIANTAGFHFATIEQGGTSLYPSEALRATHEEVLRILISIGPTETMHFQT